jgi:hypothetical protein
MIGSFQSTMVQKEGSEMVQRVTVPLPTSPGHLSFVLTPLNSRRMGNVTGMPTNSATSPHQGLRENRPDAQAKESVAKKGDLEVAKENVRKSVESMVWDRHNH